MRGDELDGFTIMMDWSERERIGVRERGLERVRERIGGREKRSLQERERGFER